MTDFEPGETCRRLAGLFSDVVDGDAPDELVQEAISHMKTCRYCEGEFSRFKELVEECRAMANPEPSRECRQKMEKLFREFKQQEKGV